MRWKFLAGTKTNELDALPVNGSFCVYRVAGIRISQPAKIEVTNSLPGMGFCGVFAGGDHHRVDHVSGIALSAVSLFDGVMARC
jgi:hypothetical protein